MPGKKGVFAKVVPEEKERRDPSHGSGTPSKASLEALIESYDIGIESFHPGGTTLTMELAESCHVQRGSKVLDVASGAGATACLSQITASKLSSPGQRMGIAQGAQDFRS